MRRGYLTLAYGRPEYLELARSLARSLAEVSPGLPLAVVTDLVDEDLSLFDEVVPLRPDLGHDLVHKLWMDQYTPFDDTMFLDSDCLVVRSLDPVWDATEGDFVLVGEERTDGPWWGGEIAEVRERLGIAGPLPKFNSGWIRWRRGEVSAEVFATARALWPRYEELGLGQFRAGLARADEPIIAAAMALHGIPVRPDDGSVMVAPVYVRGWAHVDLARRRSRMRQHGQTVRPAVVHFCGHLRHQGYYRREAAWLRHRARPGAWLATRVAYAPLVLVDHGLRRRVLGLAYRVVMAVRRRTPTRA